MQSVSHLRPRAHRRQAPWEGPGAPADRPFGGLSSRLEKSSLAFPLESPTASDPARLSCEFKVGDGNVGGEPKPLLLPLVVQRSGKSSRYTWDGASLALVDFEREPPEDRESVNGGLARLIQTSTLAIRGLFVPRHVQENYMGYLRWKFLHRLFSSSLQVLATQAMFRAIGIGSSQALSSAAALNWLLKDGLGRLSRCIYTASLGSTFDTNLKVLHIDLVQPKHRNRAADSSFPQKFLLLATLANVAKSISLAAYIATGSAIHRSFAIADNLGEVSAKAQTVCFDNLGLVLAGLLNVLGRNNRRFQTGVTFVIYPIFAAIELFSIYQALKHVHLQTLTKNRLEIIIDAWVRSGYVPSPAEVSHEEGVDFLNLKGNKAWPIRIGCVDPGFQTSAFSLPILQCLSDKDPYFICVETAHSNWTRKPKQRILLSLQEGAGTSEIIMGLLQACLLRRELVASGGVIPAEWLRAVDDCRRRAAEDLPALSEDIRRRGWATKNVLLSSPEQARYTLVDDG